MKISLLNLNRSRLLSLNRTTVLNITGLYSRLAKAKELHVLKQSKNEEISLLGCIQLGDVGTIVFKSWEHFNYFFPSGYSKKIIQSSFNKINLLRDALAHGQKLQLEWSQIHSLMQIISYTLSKS